MRKFLMFILSTLAIRLLITFLHKYIFVATLIFIIFALLVPAVLLMITPMKSVWKNSIMVSLRMVLNKRCRSTYHWWESSFVQEEKYSGRRIWHICRETLRLLCNYVWPVRILSIGDSRLWIPCLGSSWLRPCTRFPLRSSEQIHISSTPITPWISRLRFAVFLCSLSSMLPSTAQE